MKRYISTVFAVGMMRSTLITILLSSEKRTDLLLLLKEKPRTIEEINNELDTNSVAILPQLKKLKENGLVIMEEVGGVSARLAVNRASLKIKSRRIMPLIESVRLAVGNEHAYI
jgi:DNA-binding transcriptional ArsR family regulator